MTGNSEKRRRWTQDFVETAFQPILFPTTIASALQDHSHSFYYNFQYNFICRAPARRSATLRLPDEIDLQLYATASIPLLHKTIQIYYPKTSSFLLKKF